MFRTWLARLEIVTELHRCECFGGHDKCIHSQGQAFEFLHGQFCEKHTPGPFSLIAKKSRHDVSPPRFIFLIFPVFNLLPPRSEIANI